MTETKRRYYLKNRDAILERERLRQKKNAESPIFRNLCRARKQVCNIKESIEAYKRKLDSLRHKLKRQERLVEELALWWGEERAQRKRNF